MSERRRSSGGGLFVFAGATVLGMAYVEWGITGGIVGLFVIFVLTLFAAIGRSKA
jgi:hypothetical protein